MLICITHSRDQPPPLADPGGGAPGAPPPLTTYDFMPKTLFFLNFSSLASVAISFKHNFDRNMAKNTLKTTFFQHSKHSMIPPLTKPTPLRSNSVSATDLLNLHYIISAQNVRKYSATKNQQMGDVYSTIFRFSS